MTTDEFFATCGGGGGSVGGVGGSARKVVGQRETRRHGTTLVVPAMFAPNPEVIARRAQKDRTRKRDAAAALQDSNSGGSAPPHIGEGAMVADPPLVPIGNMSRCCCEAEDCTGDVSKSHHRCARTNRRVFAWCMAQGTNEGFGNMGLCIRCGAFVAEQRGPGR